MKKLAITQEVSGTVDQVCERVTESIKGVGFGILTRIDFDQKMKEKLGETIPRTVILGACNPRLAFEAFKQTTDVALLVPCNIVVRDIGSGKVMVEAMRPTQMLDFLDGLRQTEDVTKAEENLRKVIQSL